MSRPVFYATLDQRVTDPYGAPVANQQVRIYTAQTGGSQITDLLFVNSTTGALGAAVPSGVLISDSNGFLPAFASVDGGRDVVYADSVPYGRTALISDPTSAGGGGGGAVSSVVGQTGAVTGTQIAADAAMTGTYAPLASPALTGNPTAPTPAAGDTDTSIATTAFVQTTAAGVSAGLAIALGGI